MLNFKLKFLATFAAADAIAAAADAVTAAVSSATQLFLYFGWLFLP